MRIVSVVLLVLVLVIIMASVDVWHVRANEYFGDGQMYAIQAGGRFVALVKAWGLYVIYGRLDDCRIVPLWSEVSDAAKTECGLKFNEKQTIFRGWYEFRGHPRPFCGALAIENMPPQCRGE